MLPTTVALVVVQEMCARMGAVTGKGLSDLIRESFGVKITFYVMIALLLTNLGNTVSEFAGIAASMELFGISKYVSVPLGAVVVWLLIVKGSYRIVEKVFLVACLVYIAYPVAAFMSGPDWGDVLKASVVPDFKVTPDSVTMMIGVVGTTIAPWMQFYQQSSVVDKGLNTKQLNFERVDTAIGTVFLTIAAAAIIIACAAAFFNKAGVGATQITSAEQAAQVRGVAAKEFVLEADEGLGVAGVALAGGTAEELPVDPSGLVALAGDDV